MDFGNNGNICLRPAKSTKRGVIAVLFLFVVGFIFGAISLSMQTGQVIERRITSDQAAENAAFALASKSAQGLNFIAANNLAIAGASHMTGALHLVADWVILLKLLFKSDCYKMGQFDPDEFDSVYTWFRPLAKIYLRAATGMTRINSFIGLSFPIIGLLDAISVGSANAPGSLIIPFGARKSAPPSGNTGNVHLIDRLKTTIKDLIKNISPNYEGLKRINSDETFCLAYKSGHMAQPGSWPDVDHWITSELLPKGGPSAGAEDTLKAVVGMIDALNDVFAHLGILGVIVRYRVGFAAECGFGETGKFQGGEPKDSRSVAELLKIVLLGPISGREADIVPAGPGHPRQYISNTRYGTERDLASDVNKNMASDCQTQGQWSSRHLGYQERVNPNGNFALGTQPNPDPGKFICIYPKEPKSFKRYPFDTGGYQSGSPTRQAEPIPSTNLLYDYNVACWGTVLFEWGAFSGLQADVPRDANGVPTGDKTLTFKPAIGHDPVNTNPTDIHAEICPSFNANANTNTSIIYHSEIGKTLEHPFVERILERLKYDPGDLASEPHLEPRNPTTGTADEIIHYINCATGVPRECPFYETGGRGYFEDKAGHKFYPELDKLNWLCPIDDAKIDESIFFRTFALGYFDASNSQIQIWHNRRLLEIREKMGCKEYRDYNKNDPKPPNHPPPAPLDNSTDASNSYCGDGGHMCWQRGLQKKLGDDLKQGMLSFTVPQGGSGAGGPTPLEASLEYGVMTINPLRIDNHNDITGRNDSSPLAHCPKNMSATVSLENGGQIEVCDVQPVIGMISRMIKDGKGNLVAMKSEEQFGLGDANLASGGGIETGSSGALGVSGFMAISQAGVKFMQDSQVGDPPLFDPKKPSKAKTYELFWPSWKPRILPSRVMSSMMPGAIAPLVED